MIYRTEHPKPQFMRENWLNLNGSWDFEIDHGGSGEARELYKPEADLSKKIQVPFCPESKLSGIGYTDFMNSVWYRREIEITEAQLSNLVILHCGAADYFTTIYVNGQKCGTHKGGYVSFSVDITRYLFAGKNVITIHVEDDTRSRLIPSGKQSTHYESYSCYYTRTTGIWQTVWLEFVPDTHIIKTKYYGDINNGTITVFAELQGAGTFAVKASYKGTAMGEATVSSDGGTAVAVVKLAEKHLWQVGKGDLYDLALSYGEDQVTSYFGLRSIQLTDKKFLLQRKICISASHSGAGFYPGWNLHSTF